MGAPPSSAPTFNPTEYALRRREQIERAKELRAARSTMMGTGISRMDSGKPKLTRSLSSDDVAGSLSHQRASRSTYTDSRRRSTSSTSSSPLVSHPGTQSSTRRNSLSTSVEALFHTASTTTAPSVAGRAINATSNELPSSTVPAGSRSSPASAGRFDGQQGSGRQQKPRRPNERKRPVAVQQTLKLDDVALFSEEELAAFRCAGMAAESEAAIGAGIPAGTDAGGESIPPLAADEALKSAVDSANGDTGGHKTPRRHKRETREDTSAPGQEEEQQHPGSQNTDAEQGSKRTAGEGGGDKEQEQHGRANGPDGGFRSTGKDETKREGVSRGRRDHQPPPLLANRSASPYGADDRTRVEGADEVARNQNPGGGTGEAAKGVEHWRHGEGGATPKSSGKKGGKLLRTLSATVNLFKRAFMGASSSSPSAATASPAAAAAAEATSAAPSNARREAVTGVCGGPGRKAAGTSTIGAGGTAVASGNTGTSTSTSSGIMVSATGNLVTPTRTLHPIVAPAASAPVLPNPAPYPAAADITPRALFHAPIAPAAAAGPASASTAPSTPQYQYTLRHTSREPASASASPHSAAFAPTPWDPFGAASVPASPAASEGAGGWGHSRRKRWTSIGGAGSFVALGGMSADRAGGRTEGKGTDGADSAGYVPPHGTNDMTKEEGETGAAMGGMANASDDEQHFGRRSDRQGRATWSATPGDTTAVERQEASSGAGSKSKSRRRSDRVHPEPYTPASPFAASVPSAPSANRAYSAPKTRQATTRLVGGAAAAVAATGLGRSPGKAAVGGESGEDVEDDVSEAVHAWAQQRNRSVLNGHGDGRGEGRQRQQQQQQEEQVGVERWLQQRLLDGCSGSEASRSAAWEPQLGGDGSAAAGTADFASGKRRESSGGRGEGKKKEAAGRARWEAVDGETQEEATDAGKERMSGGDGSGKVKRKTGTGSGRVKKSGGLDASGGEEAATGERQKVKKRPGAVGADGLKIHESGEHSDKENGAAGKLKLKGSGKGKLKTRAAAEGVVGTDDPSGDGTVMVERSGADANGKEIKRKKKVVKVKRTSESCEGGGGEACEELTANVTAGTESVTKVKKKKVGQGVKKSSGDADDGGACDAEGLKVVKKGGKKKRPARSSNATCADADMLKSASVTEAGL